MDKKYHSNPLKTSPIDKSQQPEMLTEQIERRRKRGMEEIIKVVNKGNHPVYSSFEVISTSDRPYTVQIRSVTELINACTCPDYFSNTIGTCKHIEGVLLNLKKQYRNKRTLNRPAKPSIPDTREIDRLNDNDY